MSSPGPHSLPHSSLSIPSSLQQGYMYVEEITRQEALREKAEIAARLKNCPQVQVGKTLILWMEKPAEWDNLDWISKMRLKREYLVRECGFDKIWFEEDQRPRGQELILAFHINYFASFEVWDHPNFDQPFADTQILINWLCKKSNGSLFELSKTDTDRLGGAMWRQNEAFKHRQSKIDQNRALEQAEQQAELQRLKTPKRSPPKKYQGSRQQGATSTIKAHNANVLQQMHANSIQSGSLLQGSQGATKPSYQPRDPSYQHECAQSTAIKRSASSMSPDLSNAQSDPSKKRCGRPPKYTVAEEVKQDVRSAVTGTITSIYSKASRLAVNQITNGTAKPKMTPANALLFARSSSLLQAPLEPQIMSGSRNVNTRRPPSKFVRAQYGNPSTTGGIVRPGLVRRPRLCTNYGTTQHSRRMIEHFRALVDRYVILMKLKMGQSFIMTGNMLKRPAMKTALENLSVMIGLRGWSAAAFSNVLTAIDSLSRSHFDDIFGVQDKLQSANYLDRDLAYDQLRNDRHSAMLAQCNHLDRLINLMTSVYIPSAVRSSPEAEARSRNLSLIPEPACGSQPMATLSAY